MTAADTRASADVLSADDGNGDTRPVRPEERLGSLGIAVLPGAILVYLSFEAGGYFPNSSALVTLLLTQILLLRVLFARDPFAGVTRLGLVAVGSFAGYCAWTLASGLWSTAPDRALVDFDRVLLYLLVLTLFATIPRESWRIGVMVRSVAVGAAFVCSVALITRLLPHVWPIRPGVANDRLSYPLTYWNALGLLAAVALILLLGIAANPRESRTGRALAAAWTPIVATTLFLTFSRGAIASLVVGLVVLGLAAASTSSPFALVSVVPPVGYALITAYHANHLDSMTPTTPAAVAQGHTVAAAVVIAAVAAGLLRLALTWPEAAVGRRMSRRDPIPRSAKLGGLVATLVVILVAAVAVGAPGWLSRQYHGFANAPTVQKADLRLRLTDPSSDGRVDHWRVALKVFVQHPVGGTGSGTFEFAWYRYRNGKGPVVDAHSLVFQTLAELGAIGLGLLCATFLIIAVALFRRRRDSDRILYATAFAAVVVWMLHAGVDWDWQMPAVSAFVFAFGGAALSGGDTRQAPGPQQARWRVPLALALVAAAVTPAALMLSEQHLMRAAKAFELGACRQVESQSLDAISVLADRPQPYEMLGYCELYGGRAADAVAALGKAVAAEPGSWEFHYGLSIAQAYAGIDPRPQLRRAMALDPGDPLVEQMASVLRTRSSRRWLATARTAYANTFASGRLTLR